MHIIKPRPTKPPLPFHMTNLKPQIRQLISEETPRSIQRTDIAANNLSIGKQFRELDRPDAGACADVEDVFELGWGEGCGVEMAREGEGEDVVLEVETMGLARVGREDVKAVLEAVVRS